MNNKLRNALKEIRYLSLDMCCNYIDYKINITKEGINVEELQQEIEEILYNMKFLDKFYDKDYITLEEYWKIKNKMIEDIIQTSQSSINPDFK